MLRGYVMNLDTLDHNKDVLTRQQCLLAWRSHPPIRRFLAKVRILTIQHMVDDLTLTCVGFFTSFLVLSVRIGCSPRYYSL